MDNIFNHHCSYHMDNNGCNSDNKLCTSCSGIPCLVNCSSDRRHWSAARSDSVVVRSHSGGSDDVVTICITVRTQR